jgi:hypothetical protein
MINNDLTILNQLRNEAVAKGMDLLVQMVDVAIEYDLTIEDIKAVLDYRLSLLKGCNPPAVPDNMQV